MPSRKPPAGLSNGMLLLLLVVALLVGCDLWLRSRTKPPVASVLMPPLLADGWINVAQAPGDDELEGKVILVDCWATWCGPCRAKMPSLVEFHDRYRQRKVALIGLTPESAAEAATVAGYVQSVPGLEWPIGYGARDFLQDLQVNSLPTLLVFDRSRRLAWRGHDLGSAENAILGLLARGE